MPQKQGMSMAAAAVAVYAVVLGVAARAETVIEAESAPIRTEGGQIGGGIWNLWSNGRVGASLKIAAAGTYQINVRAYGSPAADEWPKMGLLVDLAASQTASLSGSFASSRTASIAEKSRWSLRLRQGSR